MLTHSCTPSSRAAAGRRRPPRGHARALRPRPEPLEGRLALSTFAVSNTDDAGLGSLRQAAVDADASPGPDTIEFAPGLTGTITLTSGSIDLNDAAETAIRGPGGGRLSVSGNDASRVFRVGHDATAAIAGLTIVDGRAAGPGVSGSGGGILNQGTLAIADCIVSGNTGVSGAGICNLTGAMTIISSTVSGNTSGDSGGGISNRAGVMTISGSTVSGNTSGNFGGGILNDASVMTISGSTVSGNTSGDSGGGILHFAGAMTIVSSTVSGNTSGDSGGGISSLVSAMTISGSTVSDNSGVTGAGISIELGELELNNSIVADNAGGDLAVDPNSPPLSGSHNLIEDGDTGGLADTISGRDPLLGPLRDNGGPTLTHALLPGSPAVDAGSVALIPAGVVTDQRGDGFARTGDGKVDLGAYQVQLPTVPVGQAFSVSLLEILRRGHVVGTVQAGTPDPGQGLDFAITGITDGRGTPLDPGLFRIDAGGRILVEDPLGGALAGLLGDGFVVTVRVTAAGFPTKATTRTIRITQTLL